MQNLRKQQQLRKGAALRRAILCGLGLPLAALPALAQDSSSGEPTELKTVVVTGTRLTTAEVEGSLSVTAVDLESPVNKGYPKLSDTLRAKLPQYGGPGFVNEGFGNGGDGSSGISLRGLPSDATLVLVNGRRVSSEDLNLIPEAAIDRVEVLNDGAGAIYGSDAVAGVVNVILKTSYSGLKLDAYYANTTKNDISQRKFSALFGESTEKSSFVFSAEYSASNDQLSVDRQRSMPTGDQVSGTSNPGTFYNPTPPAGTTALRWSLVPGNTRGLTNATQIPAGFNPLAVVDTSAAANASARNAIRNAEEARLNALLPANTPVRYGPSPSLAAGVNPGFPYGFYTTAYRPHERYSTYGAFDHKIFEENLQAFGQVYYSRNTSEFQLAPSPLAGRSLQAANYWYQQVFPAAAATGNRMTVSYRPVELGPRIVQNDFETFHGVAGLKGRIAESTWNWEVGFTWDRWENDETEVGGVLASAYDAALADPTLAGAFNVFGYTPIGGSTAVNSAALLNSFAGSATTKDVFTTQMLDGKVGGEVVDLPGGPLAVSIGGEMRREKEEYEPDFAKQNGSVFPFNQLQPLYAQRDIYSIYGEVLIPIFGRDMDIPAFSSFSVSAAARYEDYSDVGDTGVKPRVSFRWQPVGRTFTLRGSFAQGFVAPGFFDLYQEPGQDFTELYNPVTDERKQPEEAVLTVGNPNLKPSESDSFLIGGVFSPDFLKGFSLGANYYRIEQSKIPFQSAQYIVNQWWAAGGDTNPANPWGAAAAPSGANPLGSQVELTGTGDLYQVRNVGAINSGERLTDGIDLIASQEFDTSVGKFTLTGQATRVLTFEQEDFPGSGPIDYLGKYWTGGAALPETGFPEWRANISLSYEWDRFSGAIAWNFAGGYQEDLTGNNFLPPDQEISEVRDYNTFDIRVGYRIPWAEVEAMIGVNNVFDEQPPYVASSFENGYDRRLADIRGRTIWVSLSKKF
jgi:iron complex outermembrane receptor protein